MEHSYRCCKQKSQLHAIVFNQRTCDQQSDKLSLNRMGWGVGVKKIKKTDRINECSSKQNFFDGIDCKY